MLSYLQMSLFILMFVLGYFCNEIESYQLWKSLEYFSILWLIKHKVRFEYVQLKIVWFCFKSIAWLPKTIDFLFWKSLKYSDIFW